MNYFLLIDGAFFEDRLRPALTASWRQRSFTACRDLCKAILMRVEEFHARYHVGEGKSLLEQATDYLGFRRDIWYALAGELLLYAADEMPEFQTSLETLSVLVAPEQRPLIEQSHQGSRPLTFGAAIYRPDHCGFNHHEDVRRLSSFLGRLDPLVWNAAQLLDIDEREREEELAFARDCFRALADTYRRAAEQGQVIVREQIL